MKKTLRLTTKLLAIVLIIATLAGGVTAFAASRTQTLSKAPDLFNYVLQGYNGDGRGPIIITRGTLQDRSGLGKKTVYLVTLAGTDNHLQQSTNALSDVLAGINLPNAYFDRATSAILKAVPKNANLILAGHSLGGMVAQQLAANPTIKSKYKILNTVTFGSPLTAPGLQEGTTRRLADKADPVPYLSVNTLFFPIHIAIGMKTESAGYSVSQGWEAHGCSYSNAKVWGAYDVLGDKGGRKQLVLDMNTQQFFKAPTYFGLPY